MAALGHVRCRELPVLLGLVEPAQETLLLLRLRDVQEELPDQHAVACQVALEAADVAVALLPDPVRDQPWRQLLMREDLGVHAHHEHLLVVRAVEDADTPALGQGAIAAPQVIVIQLLVRGHLERVDLAALRVHARHDVLDGAVLPGGVHRLEDQQHPPAVLRVELVLQLGQRVDADLQRLLRARLVFPPESARVGRIDVLEPETVPVLDAIGLGELARHLDDFADLHVDSSVFTAPCARVRARFSQDKRVRSR